MNKRGGSNKACSWEIFLKKNKKNSMLIRDFRVRSLFLILIKLKSNNKVSNLKDIILTPLNTSRFMQTVQLAIAQDNPKSTKHVKLAQILCKFAPF